MPKAEDDIFHVKTYEATHKMQLLSSSLSADTSCKHKYLATINKYTLATPCMHVIISLII